MEISLLGCVSGCPALPLTTRVPALGTHPSLSGLRLLISAVGRCHPRGHSSTDGWGRGALAATEYPAPSARPTLSPMEEEAEAARSWMVSVPEG